MHSKNYSLGDLFTHKIYYCPKTIKSVDFCEQNKLDKVTFGIVNDKPANAMLQEGEVALSL